MTILLEKVLDMCGTTHISVLSLCSVDMMGILVHGFFGRLLASWQSQRVYDMRL